MLNYFRFPTSLGMVVAIAVTVAHPPAVMAQSVAPSTQSTAPMNAAPIYLQAVDQLDKDDGPDADAAIDHQVEAYLAAQKPRLDLLLRASAMQRCNWSTPHALSEIGGLSRFRRLANIGILRARYEMSRHQPAAAADDLLAVIALGRHVGQTPLLITELVGIGIVNSAVDEMARVLPELPKELVAGLPARIDALPPTVGLGGVVLGEYVYALDLAKARGADGEGWDVATVTSAKPFYDAVAKSASLAPEPFAQQMLAELAKLPPGNGRTFAAQLVPALEPIRVPTASSEAKYAMLRAAADVSARGPDALTQSRDPFGDGPFVYRPAPGGFDLSSKLAVRGQAVTLHVGPATKPAT